MQLPLEAVPNFSEGRDRATIDAIAAALAGHAELLDVHSDEDHNRSVYTLVGEAEQLVEALVAGIATARERIDLRRHEGAHPRIGAADVVPVVGVRPEDAERARAAALELARRVGEELALPVFLYADCAPGRGPAFFRRGGPEELQRRIDAGELAPDFGPAVLDPGVGGVIVGARRPLIAFNVDLDGDDLEAAQAIARIVRERDGGFVGVRALGGPAQRARPGEHEHRGLGGVAAARGRRVDRARGGIAGPRGDRLRARRTDAGGGGRRGGRARRSSSRASIRHACSSFGCWPASRTASAQSAITAATAVTPAATRKNGVSPNVP